MRIRCISYIINPVVQAFLFSEVVQMGELESYEEKAQNGE